MSSKYTMVGTPLQAPPTGLGPLMWGRAVGEVKMLLQTTHPGVISDKVCFRLVGSAVTTNQSIVCTSRGRASSYFTRVVLDFSTVTNYT